MGEGERCGAQSGLGVAGSGRSVVECAEVAVPVDEGNALDEILREANHRVVDRGVTVRVQLAHDIADDAGRFDVPLIGAKAHFRHLVEDAALHRLEAVTRVR